MEPDVAYLSRNRSRASVAFRTSPAVIESAGKGRLRWLKGIALAASVGVMLGCAGPRPSVGSSSDSFGSLNTTRLRLPQVSKGQTCPATPVRDLGGHLGEARGSTPFFMLGGDSLAALLRQSIGQPTKVAWAATSQYMGPVRIRGARIDEPGSVFFSASDNKWSGKPRLTVDGIHLVPELDLLDSHSWFPNAPARWRIWPSHVYITSPGCYAFQVDGLQLSRVIVLAL